MRIKLLTFDKHVETPEAFEKRADEAVAALGRITSLNVQIIDSKVIWKLEYNDTPSVQEFYMLTWLDTGNAEGILNNVASQLEAGGKSVMSVDLTYFTTKRVLASILVCADKPNDVVISNEKSQASESTKAAGQGEISEAEESPSQQNQDVDAKSVGRAKPQRKRTNRNSDGGGPKDDT